MYVHVSEGAQRLKRLWTPMELELQVVLGCLVWVVGPELGLSAGAACSFSC